MGTKTKQPRGFALGIAVAVAFVAAAFAIASAAAATASDQSAAAASSSLQSQIDSDNSQITILDQQIAGYQAQLQEIGADKKTLQAAIDSLDLQKNTLEAQEAVTQREINITQAQITEIGGEINDTQAQIAQDLAAIAANLRNIQRADDQSLFMQVIAAGNLADAWTDVNANLQVGEAVQNDMQALQAQETTLADSETASQQKQATLAAQQQSLASQQQSVAATAAQKSQLLTQTNAQESKYQQLLADAEAQIKSFTAFVQAAGGAGLVGNETICDSWGCYYNQRDSAWGSDALNGTQFTLANSGCLVASVAMVMTHYGYRTVTPVTINSNPSNFAVYYPAYLLDTIVVDGQTVTRTVAAIDTTLATGNPVIVGVHAYGGTHYVVLVSGSKGSYIMRDPYITDGNNITFAAHYSLASIFSVAKVVISS